jgi:hypothetical protein
MIDIQVSSPSTLRKGEGFLIDLSGALNQKVLTPFSVELLE